MSLQIHLGGWDQQRLRHGITLRLLEQLPEDKLASHPIANMRTPVELVVHFYGFMRLAAESVLAGSLGTFDDAGTVASIKTKKQLLDFVKQQWAAADRAATSVTEKQLDAIVTTPWGEFPGRAMIGILYTEYLHHRGQLYAYLRVLGQEPVMMWDFEHNAAEFQPKQPA